MSDDKESKGPEHAPDCDGNCDAPLEFQLATIDDALESFARMMDTFAGEWRKAVAADVSDYAKASFLLACIRDLHEVTAVNIPLLELGVVVAAAKIRDHISKQN